MKKTLFFLLVLLCGGFNAAADETTDRIVAVVNDDVITLQQLARRTALVMRELDESRLSRAQRSRLQEETLQTLIDETLLEQFAIKNGLRMHSDEIDRAVRVIEQQNNLPEGALINPNDPLSGTLLRQIQNSILWQKTLERQVRPRVVVSDAEVDRLLKSLLAEKRVLERELSHILIPETNIRGEAQRRISEIYNDITAGGDFVTLAKAFSKDSTAETGGYIGWLSTGELAPALERALEGVAVGGVTEPVQSNAGWHIVRVNAVRETNPLQPQEKTTVSFWKINVNLPGDREERRALIQTLNDLEAMPTADKAAAVKKLAATAAFDGSVFFENLPLESLSTDVARILEPLAAGALSERNLESRNITQYLLTEKRTQSKEANTDQFRDRLRNRLEQTRMNMSGQRFLRDLRADAFIDIRL